MAKKEMNFEEKMEELEKIVAQMEKGEKNLDESIILFENGMKLSKECNEFLENAEKKITILINKENEVIEENFEDNN